MAEPSSPQGSKLLKGMIHSDIEKYQLRFLNFPPEVRNNIYKFCAAPITLVMSMNASVETCCTWNGLRLFKTKPPTPSGLSCCNSVVFDPTGFVRPNAACRSENLVSLFRTCRQIANEGRNILLSESRVSFRSTQDFMDCFMQPDSISYLNFSMVDLRIKFISLGLIRSLHIQLSLPAVFRNLDMDPSQHLTTRMLEVIHSDMPNLKHLILNIGSISDGCFSTLPVSWLLRGLFRLRGLSSFQILIDGRKIGDSDFASGCVGVLGIATLQALQEILCTEYRTVSGGKAGLAFPGGLLECSVKDMHLTVGRAILRQLRHRSDLARRNHFDDGDTWDDKMMRKMLLYTIDWFGIFQNTLTDVEVMAPNGNEADDMELYFYGGRSHWRHGV